MTKKTKNKKNAAVWKVIFSLFMILVAFAVLKMVPGLGLEKLPETFARFDARWALLGTVGCLIQVGFQVLRLWVVFPARERPPFFRTLNAVSVGQLLNAVAPMRTGDAYKVVALSRSDWSAPLSVAVATSFMLAERVADNVALFVAVGWAESGLLVEFFGKAKAGIAENGLNAVIALICAAVLVGILSYAFRKKLETLREKLLEFAKHFGKLMVSPQFVLCLAMALATWLMEAVALGTMARGIGVELTVSQLISAIFVMNLGIALPVTVASVGVFEASLAFGLSRFGVEPVTGIAIASIHHINQLISLGTWSAIAALYQRRQKGSSSAQVTSKLATD
jgi:uncharacterized membrane protein YbhN (UPF0104 family)